MEYKHQYRAHLESCTGTACQVVTFWAQNRSHAFALLAERYPGFCPMELKRIQ